MGEGGTVTDFVPDVGVLVVHGIGSQKEGSEQRHWLEAVLRFLESFPAASTAGNASERIVQSNPSGDGFARLRTPPLGGQGEADRQRWLIGEAWWAESFDVPDRGEVSRWLVDVSSWFVYLFVVRLWRRFRVRRRHVLVGLAVAASAVVSLWVAIGDGTGVWELAAPIAFAVLILLGFLLSDSRLAAVVVATSVLVLYPLAALASAGMLIVWLVGLLPGKVFARVRAFQMSLAGSVGDVYALISSRPREQAMFDALSASALRLAEAPHMKDKPMVLMAHSQGAALCYRALNHDPGLTLALMGRPVTLVTYGGAILPVHLLEHRLRNARPGWQRIQGLAGLIGLLLFALPLARVAANAVDPFATTAAAVSGVLVAGSFFATWRQERAARCPAHEVVVRDDAKVAGHDPKVFGDEPKVDPEVCPEVGKAGATFLRWVDLWAPWDPVPNGPLLLGSSAGVPANTHAALALPAAAADEFLSCRVSNVHQPWRDHVVYRHNDEDVVSRWVGEIAARARAVPPKKTERPRVPNGNAEAARLWRWRRGVALLLGQVVVLLAGIIVIIHRWHEADDLGRWAARHVPLRSVTENVTGFVPEWIRDGVFGDGRDASHLQGLLVAAAGLAIAIAFATVVVSWWQSQATGRYLAGQEDRVLMAPTGLFASVAAAMVLAAVLVGAWLVPIDEMEVREVKIRAATVESGDSTTTSDSTEVRLEPIGLDDDTPVVVKVGDEARRIELDAEVSYRVTATAAGGKDCAVTFDASYETVRVTCAPSAAILPAGGR